MTHTIKLTDWQKESVEWAFGAMDDYWGGGCKAGESPGPDGEVIIDGDYTIPPDAHMPYLDGNTLFLSNWNEINDDLCYRVSEQLVDMVLDQSGMTYSDREANAKALSLRQLGDKIKDIIIEIGD